MMVMGEIVDECMHEITTAWCSLCKDKSDPARQSRRDTARQWGAASNYTDPSGNRGNGSSLIAKHSSTCPSCDDDIEPGEKITLIDDEWVCAYCTAEYYHPSHGGH